MAHPRGRVSPRISRPRKVKSLRLLAEEVRWPPDVVSEIQMVNVALEHHAQAGRVGCHVFLMTTYDDIAQEVAAHYRLTAGDWHVDVETCSDQYYLVMRPLVTEDDAHPAELDALWHQMELVIGTATPEDQSARFTIDTGASLSAVDALERRLQQQGWRVKVTRLDTGDQLGARQIEIHGRPPVPVRS